MKKIPSLFKRDYSTGLIYNEVTEGCQWVTEGEGIGTKKWDGTACLIYNGRFFKRYDAKEGKMPPQDFIAAQPEFDPVTKHWPGWVPVILHDKYHLEALKSRTILRTIEDGTYELIGPKVNGNPEKMTAHHLVRHGESKLIAPRTFDELQEWFKGKDIEGIVWWRDINNYNCEKVKIKKKDFGLKRED